MTIGSRKMTPPRMLRIVPFGERYISLRPNSSTRASSGVIVAHLTPTPCCLIALAASTVIWSSVASRALDAEVVVLQIDVEVRKDQLVLDELPDDPGHLVAVELDDGVLHLDLRHACPFRRRAPGGYAMAGTRCPRSRHDVPSAMIARSRQRFATHEVTNQPPPLAGRNLFLDNLPLVEASSARAAAWVARARERGRRVLGRRAAWQWGERANGTTPVLRTHDRYGNRIDEVEFDPAWHQLMAAGVARRAARAAVAHRPRGRARRARGALHDRRCRPRPASPARRR